MSVNVHALPTDFLEHARAIQYVRLGHEGTIDGCNTAAAEALGLTSDELIGRSIFDFMPEPDSRRMRIELAVPGRRAEPLRLTLCDAHRQPYTSDCWLEIDDAGARLIAEPPLARTRHLDRQLADVLHDLAVLSRERSRAVVRERRARIEAQTANREKDEIIGMIAHELRHPLAPIRAAVHLLTIDAPEPVRARATSILARQLAQLTRLVDDLLDVSRIRQQKLKLRLARVDLATVVRAAADAFEDKMRDGGIHFECIAPPEAVWILGDSARLTQVITNVLDNAAKYTQRDGRIVLRLTANGETAVLSVRDDGSGIAPDVLPKVFELFAQQAEGERGGLGIGLAVAHGIVRMHGGAIEARSEGIGHGSEFIIRLPLAAEESSGAPVA